MQQATKNVLLQLVPWRCDMEENFQISKLSQRHPQKNF